jgi:hypothetical protein
MAHIGYGYGSEWHLLQHLGCRREVLTAAVASKVGCSALKWLDHEEQADPDTGALRLREPRGLDFLSADHPARLEWERSWPQSGNVHNWDAVARSTTNDGPTWVLIEAKAHTGELASSCGASPGGGFQQIKRVLEQTRAGLRVNGGGDWLNGFYQYANRIALLHFCASGASTHICSLSISSATVRTSVDRGAIVPRVRPPGGEPLSGRIAISASLRRLRCETMCTVCFCRHIAREYLNGEQMRRAIPYEVRRRNATVAWSGAR